MAARAVMRMAMSRWAVSRYSVGLDAVFLLPTLVKATKQTLMANEGTVIDGVVPTLDVVLGEARHSSNSWGRAERRGACGMAGEMATPRWRAW
jgi:hypothetical protein